jgi:hypothetical protein
LAKGLYSFFSIPEAFLGDSEGYGADVPLEAGITGSTSRAKLKTV